MKVLLRIVWVGLLWVGLGVGVGVCAEPAGKDEKDELLGPVGTHPPEGWSHTEVHCNHSILRGMLIAPEQVGTERDQSGVVYFDLPLPLVD